jgi:hypothetical protein
MAHLLLWNGDVRSKTPDWSLEIGAYVTALYTNMEDVEYTKALGFDASFLQIGLDPYYFNDKVKPEYGGDIVFQGSNYDGFELSKQRLNLMKSLKKKYKDDFQIYGHGWKELSHKFTNGNPDKECAIYRGAKVAINYSNFLRTRYSSDRNLRIMGSGCFCLSQWYPQVEVDFPDLITFKTDKECIKLIDYYLKHDEERTANAKLHYDLVHTRDVWSERIKEIL